MDNNIFVLAVVFTPLVGAVFSLLVTNNVAQRWLGFGTAFLTWIFSIILMRQNLAIGPQIYRMGDWQPPYGIILVSDMLSAVFALMAATVMAGGLLYAITCRDKVVRVRAFTSLFLCMETGLLGAFLTGDIFTLFVFMELMVLSSVSLVAISDNKLGLEAAIKYIFISSMGTLFLLLGIAAIYATFGSLNMADIALQLSTEGRPLLANVSAIMLLCAFLLKSAVFPFHYWQPDFHTTAPTPVHAVLSSVVVKIGVYGMIRMVTLLFVAEAETIRFWLLTLGIISIYFGGLGAFSTYDGKRMLAYSTFGQIGFILMGIGWGTNLALAAAIVYAFNHAFIKAALLMLFGVVSSKTKEKTATLVNVVGVGKSLSPIVGVLYLLGGMALAGLPPMNGFISKLALVRSGIDAESWWLVGLTVGGGIITLMYMMRTWQLVFQQNPNENTVKLKDAGQNDFALAPGILIATSLILGIWAQPLFDTANATVEQITDRTVYIDVVGLPNALDVIISLETGKE